MFYEPGEVYGVVCGGSGALCVEIAIPECWSWFAVTLKLRSVPPRARRYFWAPPVTLGPLTYLAKVHWEDEQNHDTMRYERFDELHRLSREGTSLSHEL